MEKQFGIFWIGTQRKVYSDDSYYTLGTLWKIVDTEDEALIEIKEMDLNKRNLVTVIPIYSVGYNDNLYVPYEIWHMRWC